ncbi:hypothetical protein K5Q02_20240 [Pseudomonas sp. MM211]|uniref:hypothetical protein n=1 Tax=Pseudomonas sp. MM211 TaxID=2866808 RepID=UPI001CED75EB|nr:hypothetical protein [Pseudomonas sp. MM211]UCJ16116.1 hypothetical protein K5Q02_20240 [Pseudomonas sp. MM211]
MPAEWRVIDAIDLLFAAGFINHCGLVVRAASGYRTPIDNSRLFRECVLTQIKRAYELSVCRFGSAQSSPNIASVGSGISSTVFCGVSLWIDSGVYCSDSLSVEIS